MENDDKMKLFKKILKKIGYIIILITILLGIFILTKDLIVNGMIPGEPLSYNFLVGAIIFFGGLCIGFFIINEELKEENTKLKKQIKENEII